MSEPKKIEVRYDERNLFDEVVAQNADVHAEMMDDGHLWMSVTQHSDYATETMYLNVTPTAKGRLHIIVDHEVLTND